MMIYSNNRGLRLLRNYEMVRNKEDFGVADGTILTSRDVAFLLNVHINTVRRWQNQGYLPGYRIGPRGDRRFRLEDIECFLVENKELFEHEVLKALSSKIRNCLSMS
jgi:excisionase family DNA binding protein